MTNNEFIKTLSKKTAVNTELTENLVSTFVQVLVNEVKSGNSVSIQSFGVFDSKDKAERKMYNPTTKEIQIIPCRKGMIFKMSSVLKDKINNVN